MRFLAIVKVACLSATLAMSAALDVATAKVRLTYMFWGNTDELASRKTMLKLFEQENPGIEVVPLLLADFDNKFITSVAGGKAPDVVNVCNDWHGMRARNGLFEDLTAYIARDKTIKRETFFPVTLDTLSLKGRPYALPYIAKIAHFIYNEPLLAAAGLPMPNENWTWTDLLEYSKKTTVPASKQFGLHNLSQLHAAWAFGGELFDPGMTKCIANNPKVEQGLVFYMELQDKHRVLAPSTGNFAAGKVPLFQGYSWDLQSFQKAIKTKFRWNIVGMPIDEATSARVADCRVDGLSIMKSSKHKNEAWKLVKFFTSPKAQAHVAKVEGIPVLVSMAQSDIFERVGPGYMDIDKARLLTMLPYGRLQPFGGYYGPIADKWYKNMTSMTTGRISPAQALRQFEAEANTILKTKGLK